MCSIDDAEPFAIYDNWIRPARKPHKCDGCGREIAKGEEYQFGKGLLPGDGWWKEKLCGHCLVSAQWLVAQCGGYSMGGVAEEIHEHAQDYRERGLYRLTIGTRRKWQRFDGAGLMSVPKMPAVAA